MGSYVELIRESAARLLRDGVVESFVGYRRGTVTLMNEPVLIRDASRVDELTWDGGCGANLAKYLSAVKGRVGVCLKGCDSRNLATHIVEGQVKRENVYVVGVPCTGMVDRRKVAAAAPGEIREVAEDGDKLSVRGVGFEISLARGEYLQANCAICIHRNPVIHDEMIAEPVPEQEGVDRYAGIRTIEALADKERQEYFSELIKPCIRCYACRNACPACYCPTCFVDESRPQWVGKSIDPVDTMTFHLLRAYHLAGRCTDCGACERACPVGIEVRKFTLKLEKDVLERYGWETGLSTEVRPPLDVYRENDPEEFIR